MKYCAFLLLFVSLVGCGQDIPLPKPPKENIHAQYRLMVKNTVLILGRIKINSIDAIGTATGIEKRKLICCAHEIDVGDVSYMIDVFDDDGVFERRIKVKVEKQSKDDDLCLLSAEEDLPYYVSVDGNAKDAKVGDWVYCVGSRLGMVPFAISWGSFATKDSELAPKKIACTTTVFHGNSGGGLYEANRNTLIGIVDGGYSSIGKGDCACSFSIPISKVREWLKEKPAETPEKPAK